MTPASPLPSPACINSYSREKAHKDLLAFAVHSVKSCPSCRRILDCKTTVNISVMLGTSCVKSITTCECCWPKQEPAVRRAAEKHAATLDIVRWPHRNRPARTKKSAPVADPRQGVLQIHAQGEPV